MSFISPSPLRCVGYTSQVGDGCSTGDAALRMVAAAPAFTKSNTDGSDDTEITTRNLLGHEQSMQLRVVDLYDTTLRDGTQMEGISASVNDKLKIARELHNFGEQTFKLVALMLNPEY